MERWLRYPCRESDAYVRLYCFPHAGAGSAAYRHWVSLLPSWIELCIVQLPGREDRLLEAPIHQMTPLVHELTSALVPSLTLPFAFVGHSLGGLISFEVARQLHRVEKRTPQCLFVSGMKAPHLLHTEQHVHRTDAALLRELRTLNGTAANILEYDAMVELLLPILRADVALFDSYTYMPGGPLGCPIVAFGGLEDDISHEALAAWSRHSSLPLRVSRFPGDHFFIHTAGGEVIQGIVNSLSELLETQ